MLKTLILSAAFVSAGVIGAAAQSTPSASGSADISAATHCKDASGQARLKTAATTPGSPASGSMAGSASGAAERPAGATPPATGSSGTTGSAASGTSGSASTGMTAGSSATAAANLPNC